MTCAGGPGAPRASSAEAPWLLQGWVLWNYLLKTFAEGAALTKTGIVLQDVRLEPEADPGPVWCMYGLNQFYLFIYICTHLLWSLNVCVYIYIYKYSLFLVKKYYIAISLETEAVGFLFWFLNNPMKENTRES